MSNIAQKIEECAELLIEQERQAKARRQQDRMNSLKQAKRLHNPFAIPRLGKTEFPAVELGRRESKCSRAFSVVASCR